MEECLWMLQDKDALGSINIVAMCNNLKLCKEGFFIDIYLYTCATWIGVHVYLESYLAFNHVLFNLRPLEKVCNRGHVILMAQFSCRKKGILVATSGQETKCRVVDHWKRFQYGGATRR